MTLLIATKADNAIWMLADTAITGGNIGLRERVFWPKIEAAHNSSLLGYAGDAQFGSQLIREAALRSCGDAALDFLLKSHIEKKQSVDFAYGYQGATGAHLFRISNGSADEVETLYLGDQKAFGQFQAIRHSTEIEHAPNAIHLFQCAAHDPDLIPEGLSNAIFAMMRLFPSVDRSVGGWATPYLLTSNGTQLCTYGYSVTDPITDNLSPGMAIPHGTSEAGGFGVSVTSLREGDGMVIYWLQRNSGRVYLQTLEGYDVYEFHGGPTQFKEQVQTSLGRQADLWFGDEPMQTPKKVTYLRDDQGSPRLAVADDGRSISFGWVQSSKESFKTSGVVAMGKKFDQSGDSVSPTPTKLDVTLSPDKQTAKLSLTMNGNARGHLILDSTALDELIASLASTRSEMAKVIPSEITPGTQLPSVIDPAWRTQIPPHPSIPGPLLALRHPGLGWLSFILPDNEARNLGQWLVDNARKIEPQ